MKTSYVLWADESAIGDAYSAIVGERSRQIEAVLQRVGVATRGGKATAIRYDFSEGALLQPITILAGDTKLATVKVIREELRFHVETVWHVDPDEAKGEESEGT